MFSYFNHIEYFEEYLSAYAGDCVILIGPVDGKRSCAPEPDYLSESPKHAGEWRLAASHDVRAAGEDEVGTQSVSQTSRTNLQIASRSPCTSGGGSATPSKLESLRTLVFASLVS